MPLLEIDTINKSFGGVHAVQDLTASVDQGQIFAVIGPNGAGKSTLFNIVSGVYKPDSGTVRLEGHSLAGRGPVRVSRAGVGRTFQKIRLFRSLSVLDNVIIGGLSHHSPSPWRRTLFPHGERLTRARERDRARALLAQVGLDESAHLRADTLPYGRQRMLEIARALASDPKVLLVDEPAAGLNTQEARELAAWLRLIRESGVTLVVVEHNMEFIMSLADKVLVMTSGCALFEGTPLEVQGNPEVVKAYLGEVTP